VRVAAGPLVPHVHLKNTSKALNLHRRENRLLTHEYSWVRSRSPERILSACKFLDRLTTDYSTSTRLVESFSLGVTPAKPKMLALLLALLASVGNGNVVQQQQQAPQTCWNGACAGKLATVSLCGTHIRFIFPMICA